MSAYSIETVLPVSHSQRPVTAHLLEVGLMFGSGSDRAEILSDVNLELFSGDFICVLGASGCGKTSLLRILAGYQRPTSGIVTVAGKAHRQPDANVGVVFQRPNLFPWLNIASNVEFGPKMRGIAQLERKQRVSFYLDMVGLTHAATLLPYQMSGGMLQRAAIARTLAADPTLILMDEPFGALDALTRESMQLQLSRIWKQTGKTIFFITHDVEEALLLSTRILVMAPRPGRIVTSIDNPFAHQLGNQAATALRSDKEFVQMREHLVASIRDGNQVPATP